MTPEELTKELQKELQDLKDYVYKGDFSNLKVFDKKVQFKSGAILNVLTSVPTYTPAESGETVLVNLTGTYAIYSYLNGGWRDLSASDLSLYELLSNKSTSTSLGASDTLYPSQNAVKTYVDNKKHYLAGALADLSSTTPGSTNEATITTTFRPTYVKLYYFIQGHSASAGTNQYLGKKGVALFTSTDSVINCVDWNTPDTAGNGLSGDDGKPASIQAFANTASASGAVSVGTSGNAGETYMYIYISSLASTHIILHRDVGSIDNPCNTARAKIAYEAWD